ncbi:hypothetical protein [Rhodoglobus vestalii]|uniref:hypothetical protein n=1 Tax=Rhodoglobus vestalii TaxID=193384 RepID=UPI001FE32504|nr:hypothetical protein [Rhodoglobus vestalii]
MIPTASLVAFVLVKLGGIVSSLGNATGGVVLVFAVAFGVGTGSVQAQLLLLGLIFMAIAVVSDTA